MHTCMYMYVYMYCCIIYIYIYRERERHTHTCTHNVITYTIILRSGAPARPASQMATPSKRVSY